MSQPETGNPTRNEVTLVLGGARSGKSRYAESLALHRPPPRFYLATAEAGDLEMVSRIQEHQRRRGPDWVTLEAPLDLPTQIQRLGREPAATVLVDCLTLWLSNLLLVERDVESATTDLIRACDRFEGAIIFVANEVGLGIVPDNALARAFRDHAGRLNQAVAARADRVVFVAAGLALPLKTR